MTTRTSHLLRPLVALVALVAAMAVLVLAYNASPARAIATTEVNTTADTVPADDGVCTLREAITSANRNTPSGEEIGECTGTDDILISTTGTVRLTEALPDLESDISIKGPGAGQFRISRSSGGDYRIFHVTSGTQVSISGMSISNGNVSGNGGGILNDGGTLTLRDFAVFANVAESDGGGIANLGGTLTLAGSTVDNNNATSAGGGDGGGIHSTGTTTITNSTISDNDATSGGGVYNVRGLTVIEFSTITRNGASSSGNGSGVASLGSANARTEVLSTIVSANVSTDVDFVFGTTNSFVSNGYNLIGSGNATGAFNQTGDKTGVTDPKLDALASYGGPTQTHRLKADSPAINAIPQGINGCGSTFTQDQRGVSRPQGSACDIGSFEVDPPPTVTINQSSSQTDDPTSASPINFTALFNEPVSCFTDSDVTLSGTAGATTAVVTGGPTSYNVAVSGMTRDGTVFVSVPANAATDVGGNGNSASTSTDNTVTFIANSAPTAVADSYSTNEDTTLSADGAGTNPAGVLANDTDDNSDPLTAGLVSGPSHAATDGFTLNQDGSFSYTPASNYTGTDSFTYKANDGKADSNLVTANINVAAVDDPPTAVDDQATVQEDGAPATAIDVLANDTDGDGGSKTIQSVTQPTNGAVVITDSVSGLTYEPNADYCNDPPATNLDTFTYTLNDNLAVVASSLSDPANGTVSLITSGTNTGKVLYKPDQNYNNTAATRDTFTYKVNDGQANSNNAATVSVKVDPVNDVPTVAVAAGGSCATNDRSGTINLTVRDPDGQAQTASLKLSATSNNTLTGTSATATLSGTDILLGQNGDDSLSGVGGKDLLCGGRGNDRLSGGDDADRFEGGSGTDTATDFTASQGDSRVGIP